MSDRAEIDNHVQMLNAKLRDELQVQDKILKHLEDPDHSLRIHESDKDDPDDDELDDKFQDLNRRLDENRGRFLQKCWTRDDIIRQVQDMEIQITNKMNDSKPFMDKLNRCKFATREITRRVMAALGELTMYKMLCLRLEDERLNLLQMADINFCEDL